MRRRVSKRFGWRIVPPDPFKAADSIGRGGAAPAGPDRGRGAVGLSPAEGLEKVSSPVKIRMMAEFRPAIDSLKRLATMGDAVGADVVVHRIEEFVAFRQDIDQKIENLGLYTPHDGAFGA